ncbi:hypothetical protein [Caulobacter sp. 1776]|uniref:hypothetical protein n=1 Tax=Caulobacter sp. 1776 TaxID=3156420 RepID=UPI00339907F8
MAGRNNKTLKLGQPHEGSWTITKKQVVCSLLARAIRLFICQHDMISAHVLAGAANEIIEATATANGVKSFRATVSELVKDDAKSAFLNTLNTNYNFMKHGSKDLNTKNENYHPPATEFLIFECCRNFYEIYEEEHFETKLYLLWFSARYPGMFNAEYKNESQSAFTFIANHSSNDFAEATAAVAHWLDMADREGSDAALPLLSLAGAKGPFLFKLDEHSGTS